MLTEQKTNETEQQLRRTGTRRRRPPRGRGAGSCYRHAKPALDFLLAAALAAVAIPLVLVGALLVKLTSRGPAFYSQTRLGRKGRAYRIYKLRTMVHNCENVSGPRWSCPGDPRVTPVGRFLRRTHVDELP